MGKCFAYSNLTESILSELIKLHLERKRFFSKNSCLKSQLNCCFSQGIKREMLLENRVVGYFKNDLLFIHAK